MFNATLLTTPQSRGLDTALVENLRNAWGGGDAQWLAVDEVATFDVPAKPDNLWQVWEELQTLSVDLIVLPSEGRRKKMLLADMDSTMIQQECVDELAAEAGVGERVADITARAMNGELDFEEALIERVDLLRGLPVSVIDKVLQSRITLMPGGPELLATMKRDGAYAALVSGGFTQFTGAISARLGFDEHRANTLLAEGDHLNGEVGQPILGRDAKVAALHEIAAQRGLDSSDVIAVGDGANDLGMLQLAGTGVALHAKPTVAAQTNVRVNFGDLTALLYLQGYAQSEFAEPPELL